MTEVMEMTEVTSRRRGPSALLPKLDAAVEAVWAADSAWASDLDSADAKAAYKAAKAAYKALADEAEYKGVTDTCGRCGGEGGWVGWPGFTCFDCGGYGLMPYKRVRFQAMPPTRAKREAEWRAKAEAEAAKRGENWLAFEAAYPAEAKWLAENVKTYDELAADDEDGEGYDSFFSGLKEKARKYGSLSEKQVACITREMAKREAEANARDFPRGTVEVEGEIVSLPQTNGWNGSTKTNMLVALAGEFLGNRVMGTIPEKVWDAMSDGENYSRGSLIGSRVRFTATFKMSDRDDHFGFYKSPKRVEVTHVNWHEEDA